MKEVNEKEAQYRKMTETPVVMLILELGLPTTVSMLRQGMGSVSTMALNRLAAPYGDAAIAACQACQADGMIAGASITDKRKESGWLFSDGYYTATQCMAVAENSDIKGFEDLKGKQVAVKTGTMGADYANSLKDKYGFTIASFEDSPTMYQAVIGGQAVACFEDTPIMVDSIKNGNLALKVLENTASEGSDYGLAIFNSANQEFLDMFNAGLKNIKTSGKYDEIINKYVG